MNINDNVTIDDSIDPEAVQQLAIAAAVGHIGTIVGTFGDMFEVSFPTISSTYSLLIPPYLLVHYTPPEPTVDTRNDDYDRAMSIL